MIIIISFATLILFIFLHICFFLRVCSIVIRAIYLIVVNIKTLVKKISYNILSPLCFFLLFENQIIRYIIYYMCVCVCVCVFRYLLVYFIMHIYIYEGISHLSMFVSQDRCVYVFCFCRSFSSNEKGQTIESKFSFFVNKLNKKKSILIGVDI